MGLLHRFLAISSSMYLLCTSPFFSPQLVEFDEVVKRILNYITNIFSNDKSHLDALKASLAVRLGGLGGSECSAVSTFCIFVICC